MSVSKKKHSFKNNTILFQRGGIKAIIESMRKRNNPTVVTVTEACKELRTLSVTKNINQIISQEGGIRVIIRNISRHSGNPDFLTEALKTLFALAFENESKNIISKHGGVMITLLILKKYIDHVQVQKEGYKLLRKLCENHTGNKKVILQEELHIMSTMKKYYADPHVIEELLRMLFTLTYDYIKYDIRFYGNDHIPLIIDIMRENASSTSVQMESIRLLSNLLVNDVRKYILSKHGGVHLLFHCMRTHNFDAKLCLECYVVLEKLSSYNDTIPMICSVDFVRLITNGMQAHSSNSEIQEKGSKLLRLLSITGDTM